MNGNAMGTNEGRFRSVGDLLAWASAAPAGTRVDAAQVAALLEELTDETDTPEPETNGPSAELTWREKMWTVPAETRIGVEEVAEALDRPKSFVYRRTKTDAENPLPYSKLAGVLRFRVGEVRTWLREAEEVEKALPVTSTAAERRRFGVVDTEEGAA